jgi:hypothetical protein
MSAGFLCSRPLKATCSPQVAFFSRGNKMSTTTVEDVLHALGTADAKGCERRMSKRFPYRVVQRWAPMVLGRLPSIDLFRPMLCRDLSKGGISFFWPMKPPHEQIVVEIGPPTNLKYVQAKVVGCVLEDADLQEYAVCCQFTGHVI